MRRGHGEKLTRKMEAAIAALLTHGTIERAAAEVNVAASTLKRWLALPSFDAAFREARQEALAAAVTRLQADAFQAALVLAKHLASEDPAVAVRTATAILDRAMRGAALRGERGTADASPMDATAIVQLLSSQLRQVEGAELPTAEKARLTAALSGALLKALGVDVLDRDGVLNMLYQRGPALPNGGGTN